LPICSCGVIPAALELKRKKAKDSATASFLVSTPSTGVDSIFTSYAFLDIPLTIIKPIAAIFSGIFTGIAIHFFGKKKADCKKKVK
jgi:hypothetical protein|tara:strand:- start:202 stop:459 length:258 start_codon:yes stop_codon:yes gene_type:complete